jgi:hypothetical protein
MREYAVDPLEAAFVREVMDADPRTSEPVGLVTDRYRALPEGSPQRRQRLYPVIGPDDALPVVSRSDAGSLVGMVTQFSLRHARERLLVEEPHAEKLLTLRRTGRPLVAARGDSCNN